MFITTHSVTVVIFILFKPDLFLKLQAVSSSTNKYSPVHSSLPDVFRSLALTHTPYSLSKLIKTKKAQFPLFRSYTCRFMYQKSMCSEIRLQSTISQDQDLITENCFSSFKRNKFFQHVELQRFGSVFFLSHLSQQFFFACWLKKNTSEAVSFISYGLLRPSVKKQNQGKNMLKGFKDVIIKKRACSQTAHQFTKVC